MIYKVLFVVAASGVASAADNLPACDQIPKLLCCTERVLEKCLAGCIDYISDKCPHKLYKFDRIPSAPLQSNNDIESSLPTASLPPPRTSEKKRAPARPHANGVSSVDGPAPSVSSRSLPELSEGFIEQGRPEQGSKSVPLLSSSSSRGSPPSSSRDYSRLNQQYPITEVSDADLTSDCGTESSRPPFSPCLSRKLVDEQFLACCQQHVPSNCHSLCSYEHREHVAAETLIQAVQQEQCDLKYLSSILYCANRNRDNRKCCEFLGLAASELGVGSRCLRMCNIGQSGDRIGTVEKNDLVCLSNWNVLMYCARAGLRTIN